MTGLVRKATLLTACGLLAAASAFAAVPSPASCTVPCAIVLVGHSAINVSDPYGQFTVVVKDATNSPLNGATVAVDFSGCCPGIKLSNTQNGAGVSHVANSAIATGLTDVTGTATFRIEGAAAGATSFITGTTGCASISATPSGGTAVLLTNGIDHATVFVAVPDLAGTVGTTGVDITDLSFFITDKNAFNVAIPSTHRQRSDFDFHLPVFNCSAVLNASSGFGVNLGDLSQWVSVKNAAGSAFNGPFPANCP